MAVSWLDRPNRGPGGGVDVGLVHERMGFGILMMVRV